MCSGTPECTGTGPRKLILVTGGRTRSRRALPSRRFWRIVSYGSGAGRARGVLKAWIAWERFSNWIWPSIPIPDAPYGLLRFRIVRFSGVSFTLPDGTQLIPGDLVAELHCDNTAILNLVNRAEVNRYVACRRDLQALANWLSRNHAGSQIKACYGVTILWWAAVRLGFLVRMRQSRARNWFERLFMTGLLLVYSTDTSGWLLRGNTLERFPQEVWLSSAQMQILYSQGPSKLGTRQTA